MTVNDPRLLFVRRQLLIAFGLELLVEFSFLVAFAATRGGFNGGLPTSTPPLAQAYLVVGFLVTIAVAVRTQQMVNAATRGDLVALRRLRLGTWAGIALVFSAILPAIYLNAAAAAMPPPE